MYTYFTPDQPLQKLPVSWHFRAFGAAFEILWLCKERCAYTVHSTGIIWLPFQVMR